MPPTTTSQPAVTWGTTGQYPLIAGKWQAVVKKSVFVVIQQDGNKFVANFTNQDNKGVEQHRREEGRSPRTERSQ